MAIPRGPYVRRRASSTLSPAPFSWSARRVKRRSSPSPAPIIKFEELHPTFLTAFPTSTHRRTRSDTIEPDSILPNMPTDEEVSLEAEIIEAAQDQESELESSSSAYSSSGDEDENDENEDVEDDERELAPANLEEFIVNSVEDLNGEQMDVDEPAPIATRDLGTDFRWPTDPKQLIAALKTFRQKVVQGVVATLRRKNGVVSDANMAHCREGILALFAVEMTRQIILPTKIHEMLNAVSMVEKFPQAMRNDAAQLLKNWEPHLQPVPRAPRATTKRAAASSVSKQTNKGETVSTLKGRKTAGSTKSSADLAIGGSGSPPKKHTIWGEKGIMHGASLGPKGKPQLNPDLESTRKSCAEYGHNGLTVGDWFPRQIITLARGGHGKSQGGIHEGHNGAYSVISGGVMYEKLDKDEGDILYYSEPKHSRDQIFKANSTGSGTRSLKASIRTQNPVRVFRKGIKRGSKRRRGSHQLSPFKPTIGYRYDGLYVVKECTQINVSVLPNKGKTGKAGVIMSTSTKGKGIAKATGKSVARVTRGAGASAKSATTGPSEESPAAPGTPTVAFNVFKLVRQKGQPKIDLDRPSAQERADYELINEGY